ncbi:Uma2 family endonuclease [Actinopolymorpha alba]|uniref:Uma2 family endonuclease n=1 Tax=Actinopolymorpha alba TaxID=533267 RepID=UPI0003A74CEA|nr:Uma2 family endonuclease [Actinopolymorpha alba]
MTHPAFAVDLWPDFWTEGDLAVLPDDGHRYEIIDGSLVVTPPPHGRHQNIATNLMVLLHTAAPPGWRILQAVGVRLPGANFIPDLVALRPGAVLDVWHEASDVGLVVEVASGSTQDFDRGSKAIKYAKAGIPAYWRVALDGSVTVEALVAPGQYGIVAEVKPGQAWEAAVPFPVVLDPDALIV